MIDLVEAVKFFGGIAGLGTAGFTIYDRLLKSRPIISICAAESFGVGQAYLRIKNRSDFDVVLTAIETNSAARVIFHGDTRSIVENVVGIEQHRALAPGETVHLEITLPFEFRETLERGATALNFCVRWHRAAGPTWLQGWRLRVSIRGSDLHHMLVDASRRKVEAPA
ncbi:MULTISPECIES: copper chaperone PCu(A)C [unclassified Bosea (in: a-proteobacteria)]|uniref:copper chaperone PCu(A)C n=1 Tax=unclassified Bosea (in: a-proteobacteria) TaxID=2653178 RepID=UPI000F75F987|nr:MULTISPECIES: copper chaperone PCu(A)C [unclassified Bosea (in: a-proteobacteria)]AZO79643.1 hypothetical protein BLM15_20060 [Bosea sp. Tri-49]RXT16112.1 hypothetical protein B5U98_29335 [Bosea sp. Tri-39]RXT39804.1 hypothetical protein B5U99_06380 [Bosea sp. Tri-54]